MQTDHSAVAFASNVFSPDTMAASAARAGVTDVTPTSGSVFAAADVLCSLAARARKMSDATSGVHSIETSDGTADIHMASCDSDDEVVESTRSSTRQRSRSARRKTARKTSKYSDHSDSENEYILNSQLKVSVV